MKSKLSPAMEFGTDVYCANCKTALSRYSGFIGITPPDFLSLDNKSHYPYNQLFFRSVERCPNCNYCYKKIDQISTDASQIITTSKYFLLATNHSNKIYDLTANSFLCQALILEMERNYVEAALSYLFSAWCYDEMKKVTQSKQYRKKAMSLFLLAKILDIDILTKDATGYKFETRDEFISLLIDINRRSEDFIFAEKLAKAILLNLTPDSVLKKITTYQIHLCQKQIAEERTHQDAIEYFEQIFKSTKDEESRLTDSNEEYDSNDKEEDIMNTIDWNKETFYAMTDFEYGSYEDNYGDYDSHFNIFDDDDD